MNKGLMASEGFWECFLLRDNVGTGTSAITKISKELNDNNEHSFITGFDARGGFDLHPG